MEREASVPRWRKRPLEVEAWRITKRSLQQLAEKAGGYVGLDDDGNEVLVVPTLEGEMMGRVGDYLVKGVQGEFYPVRGDIFEQSYELVIEM